MKNQKGFTLVEMAIVLVIIGLLLGGVLKGQELIENSKIKNAINDIKGTQAAFNGYIDRFRQMPGDDKCTDTGTTPDCTKRGAAWQAGVGDANGILDIAAANTFAAASVEGVSLFQQLKAAGFIGGNSADTGLSAYPRNAFGGLVGVMGNIGTAVMGLPLNGKYVCLGSVPGKAARAIDVSIDDGVADKGLLRATEGGANKEPGTAATLYDDDKQYTICTTM